MKALFVAQALCTFALLVGLVLLNVKINNIAAEAAIAREVIKGDLADMRAQLLRELAKR